MNIKRIVISAGFFLILAVTGSHAAIDQAYVERIINENREFIDYINICVTNFTPDKKNDLFTIYQKHFNAEVAYLQADYRRAFDNIYDSQKDMATLYEYILTKYYLEDSKNILDSFALDILKSKDASARQYLTLGYRDRTLARAHYISGDASHPKFYSYKIFKYKEAIDMTRRSKRYGFIALYTGQSIKSKFKIYNQMLKSETEKGSLFFKRFVDKSEEDYIKEMNKSYEDFEKDYTQKSQEKDTRQVETGKDVKDASGSAKSGAAVVTQTETAFEKKVERGVRFRKEVSVARYLINGEYDKAEPIIRSYVPNYNFKLISATFTVLSAGETHTGDKDAATTKPKTDYTKYMQHHNDNYLILTGKSALEGIIGDVKVVDSLKKDDKKVLEEGKIETGSDKKKEGDELKKVDEAKKSEEIKKNTVDEKGSGKPN